MKLHSGYIIMKNEQSKFSHWVLSQWKLDKLILHSGLFYKKGIILNCTVAISLWKVNNPKLHNPKKKKIIIIKSEFKKKSKL